MKRVVLVALAACLLPWRAAAAPPAPLLYVRFAAPAGMAVTFYPGGANVRTFPVPVTVGLRPGYIYRVMLSGFPGQPHLFLFPTLEVRATLQGPKTVRPAEHPAPLAFTPDDVGRVQGGGMLTKVVYLEDPEQALAEQSRPDQPLEIDVPPATDPLAEARLRGRPVLIVRMGEREVSPEEMMRCAIPGTLLLPGDKALGKPAAPPWVPFACVPLFDPIHGPKPPTEECLHDGGDVGAPAGIGPDGLARGIDPSDTVAEYANSRGERRLAISNRLCLCVPRFVAIRNVIGIGGFATREGAGSATARLGQAALAMRELSAQTNQNEQLETFRGRERGTNAIGRQILEETGQVELLHAFHMELATGEALGTTGLALLKGEEIVRLKRQIEFAHQFDVPYGVRHVENVSPGPQVVGKVEGMTMLVTVQETRELDAGCHLEMPPPPDRPMTLYKWADRQSGHVGDVVTFYIKFTNHGGRPITDVAVTDSLTTRLEYIPGTARADRDAVFTKQENAAGSLTLRWEVRGRLMPGQSGVVSFQARIR